MLLVHARMHVHTQTHMHALQKIGPEIQKDRE
jgi:hypothetical protein